MAPFKTETTFWDRQHGAYQSLTNDLTIVISYQRDHPSAEAMIAINVI